MRHSDVNREFPLGWPQEPGTLGAGKEKFPTGETFMFIHIKMVRIKMVLTAVAGVALWCAAVSAGQAQESVKIGLILPMTGGQASTGKQIDNAVKLYMQNNGDTVAGKKIEIILKDDAAVPDNTKRLAQELIVNDKVNFIAGFGVTPAALAAAPLATQARIPEIVMGAGTSIITERSPYIVRTSFTLAQSSTIIGDWAATNGIKKVATLTSDYAPGNDALNFFKQNFTAGGGEIVEEVKVPPRQSRFRAVSAADEGFQARRHVRVRSGRAGRQLHEAICRAGARQERHQGDRPRRRHGRRSLGRQRG